MITNTHPLDYARTVTVTPEQHDQFLWLRLAVDTERDLGREQYAKLFAMLGLASLSYGERYARLREHLVLEQMSADWTEAHKSEVPW
jgi:hypothetical protein